MSRATKLLEKVSEAGVLPGDAGRIRTEKAALTLLSFIFIWLAFSWAVAYWLLGRPWSAAIPGGYAIFSALNLLDFVRTKRYAFFKQAQLFLILCLPYLLQWSLGGFAYGSGVMIWAILCPLGALLLGGVGRRSTYAWLAAYLGLNVMSGFIDGTLATRVEPLAPPVRIVFFVMNTATVSCFIFVLLRYYLFENERVIGIVDEKNRQLDDQSRKLQEVDAIKTRFFANISHEFRTPLTLIVGPIEQALAGAHGAIQPVLQSQLEMVLRNARRLLRLINQLLDVSKIEAGRLELRASKGDIVGFLEGIVSSFVTFGERKGIRVWFERRGAVPPVWFDHEKLEKVAYNLLSNAVKFTDSGSVVVAVERDGENVLVKVRDTGKGIQDDALPRVFDRFHQVDASSTREQEGTGIGLSLARDLVALHQGTLTVTSILGKGSEFTVHLPAGEAHLSSEQRVASSETGDESLGANEVAALGPSEAPVAADGGQVDGPTVLVVDDNPDVRAYVRGCLSDRYRIEEAADGVDGLDRARELRPDLVLSDVTMPRMDGDELCRRLREDPATSRLPVILLTARASVEMKIAGLEIGADDYLTKPFDANELRARIGNVLRVREYERRVEETNRKLTRSLEELSTTTFQLADARRNALEKEIAVARSIQMSMVPAEETFSLARVRAFGRVEPATECGGDFWSYFSDAGKFLVIVGDVTGHGVGAAMVTAIAKGALDSLRRAHGGRIPAAATALAVLNDVIYSASHGKLAASAFAAEVDTSSRTLSISSAGHPPQFLLRSGHTPANLFGRGVLLGDAPGATFTSKKSEYRSGDRLVLFTDGVVERTGPGGRSYGYRRLRALLDDSSPVALADLVARIHSDVRVFGGDSPLEDDVTIVAVELV